MAREEAINHLKTIAHTAIDNGYDSAVVDAVAMAAMVLKAEPCADCVSRQAAKKIIFDEFEGWPTDEEVAQLKRLTKQFDELPSVTPAPKIGRWNCGDDMFEYAICSACKHDTGEAWDYAKKEFQILP